LHTKDSAKAGQRRIRSVTVRYDARRANSLRVHNAFVAQSS